MDQASCDISGLSAGLKVAEAAGIAAATKAVEQFALVAVIGVAKDLCPYKTGKLSESGNALPAEVDGSKVQVECGFGVFYAAAVHENLTANFTQGEAKFLEKALREAAPKFESFVGAAVAAAVQK